MVDPSDVHVQIAGGRRAMFFAIVHQRLDRQLHRGGRANQTVQDVCGVRSGLHEDALFQQRIGQGKRPYGNAALQMKALDVAEAFGSYCPAGPAIGGEVKLLGAIPYGLVKLCQQESAAQRRL